MPARPNDNPTPDDGRIPRLAIAAVVLGVVASLAIYGLSFVPGNGTAEVDWDTSEAIASPPSRDVGSGTFGVTRTNLSSIAPNEDGLLVYRVAGVVRVGSGERKATRVRCDIKSQVKGETRLARSGGLRAAWPRSSSEVDVKRQKVPDFSSVKYQSGDAKKIELPIRDVVRQYSDIRSTVVVEWDGYVEDRHTWIWKMQDGTGAGVATLPWVVIFESETRPEGTIDCLADIGAAKSRIRIPFRQTEWPITDDQPNTDDADTGDVSNVQ